MATKKTSRLNDLPLHDDPFDPSSLYTVEQACEALCIGQRTMRRWIAEGGVNSVRLKTGRAVRLRGSVLNDLLEDDE